MSTTLLKQQRQRPVRTTEITKAVAMTTPGVRMVVIHAWSYTDDEGNQVDDHEILPVVAIVATQSEEYSRYADDGRPFRTAPTHRGMEQLGWSFCSDSGSPQFDVLVYSTEFHDLAVASLVLDSSNAAYRVVVAPWPSREDPERLDRVIAEVRARAREKANKKSLRSMTAEVTRRVESR